MTDAPDFLDDFGGVGVANCPRCLIRMDVLGEDESPYFRCSNCGLIRLTE